MWRPLFGSGIDSSQLVCYLTLHGDPTANRDYWCAIDFLSLARTSNYVHNTSVLSINKAEEDS